ncbi:MAG: polysaccharide deacetylase family protein [Candidatus Omnitrophota bacterium]
MKAVYRSRRNIFLAVAAAVIIVSLFAAAFLANVDEIPVLMYHYVGPVEKGSSLYITPETFKRQMEFLRAYRYNVVSLDKVVSYIEKKEKAPPRTVAITFDDGASNNFSHAYPILKKLSIPATFFVIVDRVGVPGYMDWKELREMSASGIADIGSHSKSHPWLTSLSRDGLRDEIAGSKEILEQKLGVRVKSFCYPGGIFDDRAKAAVRDAGYVVAVATNPAKGNPRRDIYAVKRVKISESAANMFIFWAKTTPLYTWIKDKRHD